MCVSGLLGHATFYQPPLPPVRLWERICVLAMVMCIFLISNTFEHLSTFSHSLCT